jgi:hypothetical protein
MSDVKPHPFSEGEHARDEGKSEYDNPYTNDQWERAAWQHGWDTADAYHEMHASEPSQPHQTPPEPANPLLGGTGQPSDASGASGGAVRAGKEGGR